MDFHTWLSIGREHGYCSTPVCQTHEGAPISQAEEQAWDEGEDICIHVLRLYESGDQMEEVESNLPGWKK